MFHGEFGTVVKGKMSPDITLDVLIRVRRVGFAVFWGGDQMFERKGFHDIATAGSVTSLAVNAYHDVLRIHRFDVTEPATSGNDIPLSKPITSESHSTPTVMATGPVHNLLKKAGTESGEWKVTDEGMLVGTELNAHAKPFGWYTSNVVPRGPYDLHLVATVKHVDAGTSLEIMLPPAQGGCLSFDIQPLSDQSSEAGFVPTGEARRDGANQFGSPFGSRTNIAMTAGKTFDLTFHVRTTGIAVLLGGKPWFECDGMEGPRPAASPRRAPRWVSRSPSRPRSSGRARTSRWRSR